MFWLGVTLSFVGGLWLVVNAFRASVLWGLGSLLIPFVALIFGLINFGENKIPLLLSVLGIAMYFMGACESTGPPEEAKLLDRRMPQLRLLRTRSTEDAAATAGRFLHATEADRSELVTEQLQVACVQFGHAIDELLVVVVPVTAAARAVDLSQRCATGCGCARRWRRRRPAFPRRDRRGPPANGLPSSSHERVLRPEQHVLQRPEFEQDAPHHLRGFCDRRCRCRAS